MKYSRHTFLLKSTALAVVFASLLLSPATQSQVSVSGSVPAQNQAAADPAALAEKVDILTRAVTAIDLPLNEPRPVDLGLVDVPGIEKRLTEGVTAKAYSRYVEVQGRKIGQLVLSGVEKNGRQEALTTTNFTAQFDLTKPQIDPAAELKVNGSRSELKAALERLAAEPEEKEADNRAVRQTDAAPQGGSGKEGKNDLAAGYQTPSPVSVAPAPEESVAVSTDGCPIRIDMAQLKAFQQSKAITSVNGAVKSETGCSDTRDGFPLQRSYAVCSDQVDMEARTASAQFKWYYVDAGGATVDVTDCGVDTDKIFTINEDFSQCTVALDYEELTATPRSRLIYLNANNAEVQVRGCEPSDTKPAVPLTPTTDACSIKHDFAAGTSRQQGTYIYELDGAAYQARGCTDNGTTYPHIKVYTDAGGSYICQPVINSAAQTVALQSRVQITVDGLSQFITDCTPDSTSMAVVSTYDGCTDPTTWTHDLAAAVTYRHERYFFEDAGQRKYITACQASTVSYPHKYEIAGYQNHDAQLFGYALTTVYIQPDGARYNIKFSTVLDGAPQIPYVLNGTEDRPNGTSTYAGCNAYRETDKVQVWLRPDETEYEKKIGPGETAGPVDVCTNSNVGSRTKETHCRQSASEIANESGSSPAEFQKRITNFQVVSRINTDNGQEISRYCQAMSSYDTPSSPIGNPWPSQCYTPNWAALAYSCP